MSWLFDGLILLCVTGALRGGSPELQLVSQLGLTACILWRFRIFEIELKKER